MENNIEKIKKFRDDRDWKKFNSLKNMAISLVLESSEVLELFQWTKDNELPKDKLQDLKDELADVYYWVLLMSEDAGIDLQKAFEEKMAKNEVKYPIEKHKGIALKYKK